MMTSETLSDVRPSGDSPATDVERLARELIEDTKALIEEQGYCLWLCRRLRDAVICVVRDDDIPETIILDQLKIEKWRMMHEHTVYTLAELRMLAQVDDWTERMVLETKRCAPWAVITRVETRSFARVKSRLKGG
jgi:hypothetical protein